MMIKDEVLALCELSNDLLYHKIPKNKILYYIHESLCIGRKSAEQYKGKDVFSLCKRNCIEIEYIKESKETYGVTFRAQVEMDKNHTKIWIYEGSLRELSNHSGFDGRTPISYEGAVAVHLAHEFFHYLEYTQENFVSDQLDEIYRIRLPFFEKKSHVRRCSEIAAHCFTKEILGLQELPNVYDYFYLINVGKMEKESFEDMIHNNERILYDH